MHNLQCSVWLLGYVNTWVVLLSVGRFYWIAKEPIWYKVWVCEEFLNIIIYSLPDAAPYRECYSWKKQNILIFVCRICSWIWNNCVKFFIWMLHTECGYSKFVNENPYIIIPYIHQFIFSGQLILSHFESDSLLEKNYWRFKVQSSKNKAQSKIFRILFWKR